MRADAKCPGTSCRWSRTASAHLGPVDPVETAGSGGYGGEVSWLRMQEALVWAQVFCCPNPGPPREGGRTRPGTARVGPFRATHRPESTTWGTVSGMSGTWLQHLQAPVERSKGRGWVETEPGAGESSTGQARPLPSPAGASQCGRGTAPGHCLLGPPQCPVAQLEDRAGCQQLAAPQRPALRGLSGSSMLPQPCCHSQASLSCSLS